MPIWCFPRPVPRFVGHSWCQSHCSPCLLPLLPLPCSSCQGCSRLLLAPGVCAGGFDPSVPTPRNAVTSHLSPVAARGQLGAAGLCEQGAAGGAPQLGQGLPPLCHLPGCCPHQCQYLYSLSIHPLTPCVQSCPSPSQCLLCRIWRVPALGCVWRGAAVTAPQGGD